MFYQEDPAEVFYVLLQRQIKLSQLTPEGNQITMRYLSPGEAFGIIAVLREINYPVTAETQEDCELIAWQDIAEMSGTTLYTVSRTLNKWEAAGLVYCHSTQIVIRQPHALTDIAEDVQRKD